MNLKRIFGTILTVLGIAGLVYSVILFVNGQGAKHDVRALIGYGILGLIFFVSGLGLIRKTSDSA